eukprot:TRINITY_DN11118_c0_g2_i3.p1 TRINITY_DN11118_c0_g2~~TRINITY_DN11118_c0_g2_i3.p1  ORF type:complete len:109 (+),score=17.16 TRINITY_DN11118_c0_g2_i3:143-469(+)
MSGRGFGGRGRGRGRGGGRGKKVMVQPINLIFRFLQKQAKVSVWLFEHKNMSIEGTIVGFDEYMNLVIDNAEEVDSKAQSRKALGRILLKGDNICLLQNLSDPAGTSS